MKIKLKNWNEFLSNLEGAHYILAKEKNYGTLYFLLFKPVV